MSRILGQILENFDLTMLLTHYDPDLPIHVAADASSHGVGAVIYNTFPDNSIKTIHHISKS